ALKSTQPRILWGITMKNIILPLLIACLAGPVAIGDEPKKPEPKFPLGKDTTYVTGPLDKEGYVDYEAALNERLGKGITPEKNANVLIWKAVGPKLDDRPMPAEFFKRMGVDVPPEEGNYFIDLRTFARGLGGD